MLLEAAFLGVARPGWQCFGFRAACFGWSVSGGECFGLGFKGEVAFSVRCVTVSCFKTSILVRCTEMPNVLGIKQHTTKTTTQHNREQKNELLAAQQNKEKCKAPYTSQVRSVIINNDQKNEQKQYRHTWYVNYSSTTYGLIKQTSTTTTKERQVYSTTNVCIQGSLKKRKKDRTKTNMWMELKRQSP